MRGREGGEGEGGGGREGEGGRRGRGWERGEGESRDSEEEPNVFMFTQPCQPFYMLCQPLTTAVHYSRCAWPQTAHMDWTPLSTFIIIIFIHSYSFIHLWCVANKQFWHSSVEWESSSAEPG